MKGREREKWYESYKKAIKANDEEDVKYNKILEKMKSFENTERQQRNLGRGQPQPSTSSPAQQ
jgi:hypothetical protein